MKFLVFSACFRIVCSATMVLGCKTMWNNGNYMHTYLHMYICRDAKTMSCCKVVMIGFIKGVTSIINFIRIVIFFKYFLWQIFSPFTFFFYWTLLLYDWVLKIFFWYFFFISWDIYIQTFWYNISSLHLVQSFDSFIYNI